MTSKKFKDTKTWLFDLDNTLYLANLGIFSQIDEKMKKFISKKINITEEEAFKVQKKFYKKYGTTLYGLMKNYDINPDTFLEFVHDIDLKRLKKSDSLKKKIRALPGKKIIYTNADEVYATRVLKKLGIDDLFFDIFDIKKASYRPKPMIFSINKLIKTYKLKPQNVGYFDDLERNLESAHKKGIITIHISEKSDRGDESFIDFRFKTITCALDMIIKRLNVRSLNKSKY